MKHAAVAPRRRGGFTIVELMVVIAIIVLLVSLLFVVGQPLRQTSLRTKCLVNQRTIALAAQVYAGSNDGRYVSPRTDTSKPELNMGPVSNPWVNCSTTAGTLIGDVEQPSSLEKGALWPYMNQNYSAYKSPLDPNKRVRSYSLNAFVGVGGCDPNPNNKLCDDLYTYGKKTIAATQVPQPSSTMAVIGEEDDDGWNPHGWVIECQTFMSNKWIDLPSFWDGNRINIAMVDGSTKSLDIMSPKLVKAMQSFGNLYVEPSPAPAYRIMRQYMLPGVISN
jgi:prepilin-type N-terminal cleavage/methylation domain-containing protein